MIKKLINRLFGTDSNKNIGLNDKSKMIIINTVQSFMNMNRDEVYDGISDDLSYEHYTNIAKKNWNNILCNAFSKVVMNDEDISIGQQITSDIFNYYYKELLHDIRSVAYSICKSKFGIADLNFYYNDIGKLYRYLIKNRSKSFKAIHNVDRYGKDIIESELKKVVDKLLTEKMSRNYWEVVTK